MKKILLDSIVCILAINQGLYASDYGIANINDNTILENGGVMSLPAVNVPDGVNFTVGKIESGFTNGTNSTYFHISGDGDLTSEMSGTVKINQDGRVLNEAALSINGTVSNIGQLINQNTIIVGKTGTLNAGTFGATNQIGRVLNGFKWNTSTENNVRYHEFNQDSLSIASTESSDPSEAKDGTIKFIPGAQSDGNINGGNVDLTSYIEIGADEDDNGNKNVIFGNGTEQEDNTIGQKLKNTLENVNIQLFKHDEMEDKVIHLNDLLDQQKSMFSNFKFNNCTAEIPSSDVSDGGYIFRKPGDNETVISIQELTKNAVRSYNDTTSLRKIEYNENVENANFGKLKLLFDVNNQKIYHNYKDTNGSELSNNDGLVLYDAIIDKDLNKLSFSDLFNKYVDYNCYISSTESNSDNLAYAITTEEQSVNNPLNLTLKMSDKDGNIKTNSDETKSWHEKNLYIQVSKNKNIKISNKYQYDAAGEDGSTTTKSADISKPLRLNLNNPWENYSGSLLRDLPTLEALKTITTITGKESTADIKKWLYDQYAENLISEIGTPDGYTSCDTNAEKITLLARYKLSLINKQNISSISTDEAYDYLQKLAINDAPENKAIKQRNTEKLTTQIYQNYAGNAFENYSLLINTDDSEKTSKNECTNSEILEYTVNQTCNPSASDDLTNQAFSAGDKNNKKPFVVDKLTIGESKESNIDVVETSANTYIVTGGFAANKPFRLNGTLIINPKMVKETLPVNS
ncbi:MAG: hypothetical protein IJU54_01860 [Alphaproteobacteria bacterium]|nr:hypothetical protein [Alphaproteobacteria bacterium]